MEHKTIFKNREVLKVNGERLWSRMMEMAQIGGTPKGGVCRVTLTEEDKKGRDLFIKWCEDAGCTIEIDQMGNLFARRAGKRADLNPILMGSHLDSQPTGGKYDGVYGVLAALEVIESLNDLDIVTEAPIEIVSWTNEEGARFSPAMIGSGVFTGEFTLEYAYNQKDKEGVTLGEALDQIGYKGEFPIGERTYAASIEVHIEQGPILEAEKKSIGVVTGVQGIRWYDLKVKGKETHAGPCPMHLRKDPVKATLPILNEIYQLAEQFAPDSRATIGDIVPTPAVRNTVPSELNITVDLRHPQSEILDEMHYRLQEIISQYHNQNGIEVTLEEIWHSPPVAFAQDVIEAIQASVEDLKVPHMKMVSGAGHDSVYLSRVTPTAMIFIPCEDGLSHNELEKAEKEDVINGADVLLNTALKLAMY
ncbi:Zn-dependent hydrolase [Sediminitomix flava]|uniref:N-carbamoyl-L-amino-acid hydrolase n=1 Tax=Sediminitomix flava TaxID=379075 RepID=A0A315ZA07_SEDFL|nr:Zn-dependent hydrolase [Sediminitomix flava]PWJ42415.1 N-carbamoyl-L-amino-acid hydrolase [Sediminitomix flava]